MIAAAKSASGNEALCGLEAGFEGVEGKERYVGRDTRYGARLYTVSELASWV
jgi:hypothetical protein